jgi:4-alpha-glucanotransferase
VSRRAARPALAALAERLGILPGYRAAGSEEWRPTGDAAREGLLHALGLDASSEAGARAALERLAREDAARLVDPTFVGIRGTRDATKLSVRVPAGAGPEVSWSLDLIAEDGARRRREGRARLRRGQRRLLLRLPSRPDLGYHTLSFTLDAGGRLHRAQQRRIVTPPRCTPPSARLGRRKAFGLVANLYTLRSRGDHGVGDLGHLERLLRLAGDEGAAFVGLNPLHALWNRGDGISPYLPVSRLFRNPLYLDLRRVPELAESESAQRKLAELESSGRLEALRERPRIDYAGVMEAKRAVLDACHARFAKAHRDAGMARGRAYWRWVEAQGELLEKFATFVALAEQRGGRSGPDTEWQSWPAALRDPSSAAVACFRTEHAEAVDRQRWLQFELDRQLARAAGGARRRGLALGLYTDLALGSDAAGSDVWAHPDLFVRGARAGAPPDDFAPEGQDWSFPPLDPRRLCESHYAYWVRLLRAGFAHAGALRIDHAMGLSRLYWIPAGRPASEGAYVAYPERDLLGILALESRRAGAVVVGEDLGTVPRGLRSRLARRGVLSSQVLLFARTRAGAFVPARRYSARALVTANTHDLPTLAGFYADEDLALRRRAGQLPDDGALRRARQERSAAQAALDRRLSREGGLAGKATATARSAAVARFLCRTPAPLVGLSVDDLAGEAEPVNLPGVGPDRHRSWTRRLEVPIEDLGRNPHARAALAAVRTARRRR